MLTELETEINDATARARHLVDSIDGRIFTVRPHPNSWSAAECLAHLSLTTESFLPLLQSAIDDGKKRKVTTSKPPKMDLIGRVLRWFLEPPMRSRVKTTAPFVPRSTRAKSEAFAEFASLQNRLLGIVRDTDGIDLTKIKIVSPFDKRMKYNLYSAVRILAAHERRHIWQAEQAVAEIERHYAQEGAGPPPDDHPHEGAGTTSRGAT
ncbi:MAG TPA: DinB family protein [Thermoanaerobaculia bacterium]